MDSAADALPTRRFDRSALPGVRERPAGERVNSVAASQARAAHRREARRDEQAVAAWLRELSARAR